MNSFRLATLALLPVLTFAVPCSGVAQTTAGENEREVLAVVDSLFAAMKRRDGEAARRVMLPGAVFYSIVDGSQPALRTQPDTMFLRSLVAGTGTLLERYWSPTVLVSGRAAQVWTLYDFHIDGTFSHCGIDSFSLLDTADGWRLATITYTVQRSGCAPSPLGPPGSR